MKIGANWVKIYLVPPEATCAAGVWENDVDGVGVKDSAESGPVWCSSSVLRLSESEGALHHRQWLLWHRL